MQAKSSQRMKRSPASPLTLPASSLSADSDSDFSRPPKKSKSALEMQCPRRKCSTSAELPALPASVDRHHRKKKEFPAYHPLVNDLSAAQVHAAYQKLLGSNSSVIDATRSDLDVDWCYLSFAGMNKDGYARIKCPPDNKPIYAHHVGARMSREGQEQLPETKEYVASHRCHTRHCFRREHIAVESHYYNLSRKGCRRELCKHNPSCIYDAE